MTDNYNGFLWTFIILLFLLFLICFYNDKLNLNISNSKELAYILILSILCFSFAYLFSGIIIENTFVLEDKINIDDFDDKDKINEIKNLKTTGHYDFLKKTSITLLVLITIIFIINSINYINKNQYIFSLNKHRGLYVILIISFVISFSIVIDKLN
jgi:hypothetical protein